MSIISVRTQGHCRLTPTNLSAKGCLPTKGCLPLNLIQMGRSLRDWKRKPNLKVRKV
ncbi:MAG: hypothetical protein LBC02_11850 [Planctomycetaceae bacterium]|nr:hypothetical protein [Planctomycetaceae bacterium]